MSVYESPDHVILRSERSVQTESFAVYKQTSFVNSWLRSHARFHNIIKLYNKILRIDLLLFLLLLLSLSLFRLCVFELTLVNRSTCILTQ